MRKCNAKLHLFHLIVLQCCLLGIHTCTVQNLTQDEKIIVVKFHNEMRKTRADLANPDEGKFLAETYRTKIKWNNVLAEMATDLVKTCEIRIDPTEVGGFGIFGDAFFVAITSEKMPCSYDEAIVKWNTDTTFLKKNQKARIPGQPSDLGYFSQLIWAATTDFGCACAIHDGDLEGATIVCLYAPGGNLLGGVESD